MARDFTWVRDPGALAELASALDSSPSHALDTESNSGFVYDERLCLLQFNVSGRVWLVDLVALPNDREALHPLRPALEGAEPVTYLHGGEFDVGCLKRDFELTLGGVRDSQQAAAFLGWEKTSYGTLVEKTCDVQLKKGLAHQDWGRRPISPEALTYAVEDVLYLPRVCEELGRMVREADLEDEVAIANQAVMDSVWSGGYRPDGFWRIKGAGTLPESSLPVLAALYHWRDAVARRLDRPPGRLLNNRALLAMSQNPPSNEQQLRRTGLRGRLRGEESARLLAAIATARRRPAEVPPRPVRRGGGPKAARREERLRQWRRGEAEQRGVPEQVVLPTAALRQLARHGAARLSEVAQLGSKRIGLYGARLEELSSGS